MDDLQDIIFAQHLISVAQLRAVSLRPETQPLWHHAVGAFEASVQMWDAHRQATSAVSVITMGIVAMQLVSDQTERASQENATAVERILKSLGIVLSALHEMLKG